VRHYTLTLKALLRGEQVEVEGAPVQMLHGPGQAPARPIDVPMLFAAGGPNGQALAREIFDGILTVVPTPGFKWSAMVALGTVLDENETYDSPRAVEAAGPGTAILFHAGYEHALVPGLDQVPGAQEWKQAIEATPATGRHLRTHVGHLTYVNDTDRKVINGSLIQQLSFSGPADELRKRIDDVASGGTTEVVYQPAGPDLERELVAFARMAGIASG
jgi:5,10-methylenetetrahydromethanopterin reductase